MPKGYVILTEAIKDPEGMKAYGRAASPAMSQGGCKILSVETKPQVLEGRWHGHQTVVLEFDSVDAARDWYKSEAYQNGREAAAGGRRLQCGDHLRLRRLTRLLSFCQVPRARGSARDSAPASDG